MGLEIYVSPIMREWIVSELRSIETINDEPVLNSFYMYILDGANPLKALITAVKALSKDRMKLIKQIVEFEANRPPAPIIFEIKSDPESKHTLDAPLAQLIRNHELQRVLDDQEMIAKERRKRGIFD